ncbi:MAG: PQQ-binding-like beta-propeller repeat protein, partial [Anaerolineae bacterium]
LPEDPSELASDDRVAPENSTPIGTSSADLRIGADAIRGAFFLGGIDEVRLWSVARDEADIRNGMFEVVGRDPGLVAAWSLDGNGDDQLGEHNTTREQPGSYTVDGALPRDVTVPVSNANVTVDGLCEPWEYGLAERVAIDTLDSPAVNLQLSGTDLYVCFDDMLRGNLSSSFAAVHMDRDDSGTDPVQQGDYRFAITYRGSVTVEEGDGTGNYRVLNPNPGNWQAVRTTTQERWSAEFKIARNFILPPTDPEEDPAFGLALYQGGVNGFGDRPWPAGAETARPSTWAQAILGDTAGELPRHRFTGVVRLEAERDDPRPGRGIPGSAVQLLTWDEKDEALTLVDVDVTDGGGAYELEFKGRDPDAFVVRSEDARGTVSVSASPGDQGETMGANVLLYTIEADRPPVNMDIDGALFLDAVSPAALPSLDQHYLIVYDAPVTEDDLWPILEAKQEQGFRVVAVSARDLERSGTGRDLGEKIFNWLHDYWTTVEPEPVYALLVGRADRIPVRDVGWLGNDHRDPGDPDYHPRSPTDWYYADSDSGWDADGDGFFGEFLNCRPGDTYPDPDEGELDCPEAGSLSREGPFGDLRGSDDDFAAEIAVGRIAVNEPGEVRRALMAAAAAERSGAPDKRRALLAGAMWSFEGRSWNARQRRSVSGGAPGADAWLSGPWDGARPFGVDSADHLEAAVRPALNPFMSAITTLYETANPGNDPRLAPSARRPNFGLTASQLEDQWRDGRNGLIHLNGNGTRYGVVAAHWTHDWNVDARIDQPAQPEGCRGLTVVPGSQVGPPCWELLEEALADNRAPMASGVAPVVFANAGSTGNVAWVIGGADAAGNTLGLTIGPPAVAGDVLGTGSAAAWIGAYTSIKPGALDDLETRFDEELMSGLRVGDALWAAQADLGAEHPFDLRSYAVTLFGDPAMSYWGNTPSTRGPWPQSGGDWGATGSSRWSGPDAGRLAWSARDGSPSSPPVIGGDGAIVVAGRGTVVRISAAGVRLGQSPLPGAPTGAEVRFSPAVVTDGVYVAAGANLYAFDTALALRQQTRLPAGTSGDPRVGPDGAVWVPTTAGMVRVTGAGEAELLGTGAARGAAAFAPDGSVVWSEAGGVLDTYRLDLRAGGDDVSRRVLAQGTELTAPAVAVDGTIYVATAEGRVLAIPVEGTGWQRDVGGNVLARPVIADDGTVFVLTAGKLTALDGAGGAELWTARLPVPVTAAPIADASRVYLAGGSSLLAVDRATGGLDWSLALEGGIGSQGSPVIGADRTLYVLRTDNTLAAVREAGWMPAPSAVTASADGGDLVVRWRDNSAGEAGFRIDVCTIDHKCGNELMAGPNSTTMRLRSFSLERGAPLRVRVQAVGPGSGRTDAGHPAGASSPADVLASSSQSSDFAASRLTSVPPGEAASPTSVSARALSSDALLLTFSYPGDAGELEGFDIRRAQ